jgi:NADH dehydrogenase
VAELHDFVTEDLAKLYPRLIKYCKITVYDVAPTILPMFDKNLGKYAMKHFAREGVSIKTSHHIERLRPGLPGPNNLSSSGEYSYLTLDIKEEGEVGVGMVVWSTGLMTNPFVKSLRRVERVSHEAVNFSNVDADKAVNTEWLVKMDPKSGAIITDDNLRLILTPKDKRNDAARATMQVKLS